jgi:hypothetical protein
MRALQCRRENAKRCEYSARVCQDLGPGGGDSPVVSLFLSASAKQAQTIVACYTASSVADCPPPHIIVLLLISLDDFTFGNTREDIDAIQLHSNFNPFDGKPQQDDHVI